MYENHGTVDLMLNDMSTRVTLFVIPVCVTTIQSLGDQSLKRLAAGLAASGQY